MVTLVVYVCLCTVLAHRAFYNHAVSVVCPASSSSVIAIGVILATGLDIEASYLV